jgi:hypothetical protein
MPELADRQQGPPGFNVRPNDPLSHSKMPRPDSWPKMRVISRRLEKLEKIFAPVPTCEDTWGSMAEFRDELLRLAEERGAPSGLVPIFETNG